MALQTRKAAEIPAILFFFFLCIPCFWVGVAFAAPKSRRVPVNQNHTTIDSVELCSSSRKLHNHGGNYALPFYVPFRFCFFWCTRFVSILRYMSRQSAPCKRRFWMITPSLSAADIFSVLDELGDPLAYLFRYPDFLFVSVEFPLCVSWHRSQRRPASQGARLFARPNDPSCPLVLASLTAT